MNTTCPWDIAYSNTTAIFTGGDYVHTCRNCKAIVKNTTTDK